MDSEIVLLGENRQPDASQDKGERFKLDACWEGSLASWDQTLDINNGTEQEGAPLPFSCD